MTRVHDKQGEVVDKAYICQCIYTSHKKLAQVGQLVHYVAI